MTSNIKTIHKIFLAYRKQRNQSIDGDIIGLSQQIQNILRKSNKKIYQKGEIIVLPILDAGVELQVDEIQAEQHNQIIQIKSGQIDQYTIFELLQDDKKFTLFKAQFHTLYQHIGGLSTELYNIFLKILQTRTLSLQDQKKFDMKHTKGLLLYGYSGTGKTLIARKMAEILNLASIQIVNGPEILSNFNGQSERKLRELFQPVKKDQQLYGNQSKLHVIIFDEIDALFRRRGTGDSDNDSLVNQILTLIDGMLVLNNLLIIGITSRKDLLDQALLRPGRLQLQVQIKIPTLKGRLQIFQIHTRNLYKSHVIDQNVNLKQLAEKTQNFTGAEISTIVSNAVIICLNQNKNQLNNCKITQEHFLKAFRLIKPKYGEDKSHDQLQNQNNYYPNKHIFQQTEILYLVDNFKKNKQNKSFIVIQGSVGNGKTTFMLNLIKKINFDYCRWISPMDYIGKSNIQKVNQISEILKTSLDFGFSCIIFDNLETLLQITNFNTTNYQILDLLILFSELQIKNKLLIMATTSKLNELKLLQQLSKNFTNFIQLQNLTKHDVIQILKLNKCSQMEKQIINKLKSYVFKELLYYVDQFKSS